MRIAVVNFWPGAFDGPFGGAWLLFLFKEAFGQLELTHDPGSADLVLTSVFGRQPVPRERTIEFIGENIRPSVALYSLSFDFDSFGDRNIRVPLWWSRIAWPGLEEFWRECLGSTASRYTEYRELVPLDSLLRSRAPEQSTRPEFCALIANNPERLRMNLFSALSEIAPVAGFGGAFARPVASKFRTLQAYRFCLCPENSIYPGYCTEKLIEAWVAGCVPLYSGDRLTAVEFNADAYLNYQDFLDSRRYVAEVRRLESDPHAYERVRSAPLLNVRPSLVPAISFLRSVARRAGILR